MSGPFCLKLNDLQAGVSGISTAQGFERLGRFILDGYATADEFRMTGSARELIVLGMSLRTYDAAKQIWNLG